MELVEATWAVLGLLALIWAWRAAEWLWWRPRRLERTLRKQGLKGSSYRLLHGDFKENVRLIREARCRPLPLCSHDITPRIAPLVHRSIKQHGKISFQWQGPNPRVILMDPELIEEILCKKFGHFRKPKISRVLKLVLTGLLSHEGEKWAKHRRIIDPVFRLEKLKLKLPAFSSCCEEVVKRWEERIGVEVSVEVDVWPEFQRLTGDIISRAAFGSSYEEGRRLFQLLEEQAQLAQDAFFSVQIPGYRFIPTVKNLRRREVDKEVRAILMGMIERRNKAMMMGESCSDDLLGVLVESNLKDTQGRKNSKSTGMSIEDVIEECKVFHFAGHETTSVMLTWTVILLSMHTSWQIQARQEVLQVFGERKPNTEGLNRLKIVTMILYEVLRLYPPAIFINRRTYKPIEIDGIKFPSGVLLLLPAVFLHHSSEFWGEDAKEFKPERFAEGVSKASKVRGAFLPFGHGPRICIGMNFALAEAKVALCMILQRFSFQLSPSYVHAPYTIITLQPQYGAQIQLHKL